MSSSSFSSPGYVETMYVEHHGWLVTWLRSKLDTRERAADLAHDTFVRLLSARLPAMPEEPRAYLTTVARRLVIDSYRHAALEKAYLDVLATAPEDHEVSAEQQAMVLQALREIDRMLAGMPTKVRTAFLLSRVDGLDHATIATQLKVSVPRISQFLAQATRHCYAAMYGHAPGTQEGGLR